MESSLSVENIFPRPLMVTVSDPFEIDSNLYRYFLRGMEEEEVARIRMINHQNRKETQPQNIPLQSLPAFHIHHFLVDVTNHYRNIRWLEQFFITPPYSIEPPQAILPAETVQNMINSYYSFDNKLAKEFLIRKSIQKGLRDFDELKRGLHINPNSCKRQFENFRRIYKYIDECEKTVPDISKTFNISPEVAEFYSRFSFLAFHQFEISRRGYTPFEYSDIDFFAKTIMSLWTEPQEPYEIDVDFIEDMRKIREVFWRRENVTSIRELTIAQLRQSGQLGHALITKLNGFFPQFFKGLLHIIDLVINSSKLRDLFYEVIDQINETLKKHDVSSDTIEYVYLNLMQVVTNVPEIVQIDSTTTKISWGRFISCVKGMSDHMISTIVP